MIEITIFKILFWVNVGIMCIIMPFYIQHVLYFFIGLKKSRKYPDAAKNHKFAAIISARNEEKVIGALIDSIRKQNYPESRLDIFVVADNCTDNTAEIARSRGAIVYERFNDRLKGKGYALDFLMKNIMSEHSEAGYEAFVFFDADNIVHPDFVAEMNKVYDCGYKAAMGYRNAKNFGDNYVTMGNGVCFIMESRFSAGARSLLGTSTYVSGTGMMAAASIFERDGGYRSCTMIEDVELSLAETLRGGKVAYCAAAMIFDEQPRSMRDSFRQRARWVKGQLQCFKAYGGRLAKRMLAKGDYSSFDLFGHVSPGYLFAMTWTAIYYAALIILSGVYMHRTPQLMYFTLAMLAVMLAGIMLILFLMGLLVVSVESKNIRATRGQKIKAVITFPWYMLSFLPVVYYALFKKVEWKQIPHESQATAEDLLEKRDD